MNLAEKMKLIEGKIAELPTWEAWIGDVDKTPVTGPSAALAMTAVLAMSVPRLDGTVWGHHVEMASSEGKVPAIAIGETKEEAEFNARMIEYAPTLLNVVFAYASLLANQACQAVDRGDVMATNQYRDTALNSVAALAYILLGQYPDEFFAELESARQTEH